MLPVVPSRRYTWLLLGIFLILTLGIGTAGYIYFLGQKEHIKAEKQAWLSAITDLKIAQIINWRKDRLYEAGLIYGDPIVNELRRFIRGKASPEATRKVVEWLAALRDRHAYRSVSDGEEAVRRYQEAMAAGDRSASSSWT